MVPVDFFTEVAKACADRPFLLLPNENQASYLAEIKRVVVNLKTALEEKDLQKTHAYKIAQVMGQAVEGEQLDEVRFAEALAQLDTLYGPKTKPDFLAKVAEMDSFAERFKKRAHEFHILEDRIAKAVETLTPKQIVEHDQDTLKNIGLFYILEYTLILEQEILKVDATEQKKILNEGIQVEAGNLPGLLPLMKSMRQELAFQTYGTKARWNILRAFYDFDTILDTTDFTNIPAGLRKFNNDILKILVSGGVQLFSGVVYKPYPDNTPLTDIIKDLS